MECLLSEEQLAGEVGVTWIQDAATVVLEGERVEYLCGLNQTLVIRDASNPEDIGRYNCRLNSNSDIGSFLVLVLGNKYCNL